MLLRFLTFSSLAVTPLFPASAHLDGIPHSHPHLLVSNELLAGLLIASAAVFCIVAMRKKRSEIRNKSRRRQQ